MFRAMVGDTAVSPAPPQVADAHILELFRGAMLMAGVHCMEIVMDAGVAKFNPCPPSPDTVAFIMAHASLMYFSGTPAISYKTRPLSVSVHAQAMEDLRRNARNLITDIEARGMVCSATPKDGANLISLCHDLVARSYAIMPHPAYEVQEPLYPSKVTFPLP
jgi:hypothetical protein